MEWAQVLAIVLPIMLAIIIGVFYSNRRFDDVNRRFDDVNSRFGDVNQRFVELRSDMDRRFDELRSDMNEKLTTMNEEQKDIKGLLTEFLKKKAGV